MSATIAQLICLNEGIDITYTRRRNSEEFSISTRELREELDGVPLDTPQVIQFVEEYINENSAELSG
jgi:hypothetical protein